MRTHMLTALLALALMPLFSGAQDQQPQQSENRPAAPQQPANAALLRPPGQPPLSRQAPNTDLADLARQVAASSGQEFLIGANTPAQIYVGGIAPEDVTYPVFLTVLSNNGLAGVEVEGRINIVPELFVRSMSTPIVQRDDTDIPDDLWVTRIITIADSGPESDGPGRAAMLVPILRPMLPRAAHFAASPNSSSLIIVDRYANVRRMTAIIENLTD